MELSARFVFWFLVGFAVTTAARVAWRWIRPTLPRSPRYVAVDGQVVPEPATPPPREPGRLLCVCCGRRIPDEAGFCSRCGAPTPRKVIDQYVTIDRRDGLWIRHLHTVEAMPPAGAHPKTLPPRTPPGAAARPVYVDPEGWLVYRDADGSASPLPGPGRG
jgi:hypothetical protein